MTTKHGESQMSVEKPAQLSAAQFLDGARGAINTVTKFVSQYRVGSKVEIDHISYKCASGEEFDRIKGMFGHGQSRFINESMVSGRRIALIWLTHELPTSIGSISLLMIAEPKNGGKKPSRFDHISLHPKSIGYGKLVMDMEGMGISIRQRRMPHYASQDITKDGIIIRITKQRLMDKIRKLVEIEQEM